MKNLRAFVLFAILLGTSTLYAQVGHDQTTNSGTHATALGYQTTASGTHATALGYKTTASGYQSFAAGHWSAAHNPYSFALGARATASDSHAMAFGLDVSATKRMAIAIGLGADKGVPLLNNITNSLMVGFNSNIPTLFVGASNGVGTTGKVGIGTTNPNGDLHIFKAENPLLSMSNSQAELQIGVASCNSCFDAFAKPNDAVFRVLGQGDLIFSIPGVNQTRKIAFHTAYEKVMTIQEVGTAGKVGIGTTNFPTTIGGTNISNYKLFVKGGILTEEVRVRTGWADYVFEDSYKLKTLEEVENHIATQGYLPNMPSAKTVASEGIGLGNISKMQQEKIEELFLYTIQQEKKIAAQQEEIEELKKLVKSVLAQNQK